MRKPAQSLDLVVARHLRQTAGRVLVTLSKGGAFGSGAALRTRPLAMPNLLSAAHSTFAVAPRRHGTLSPQRSDRRALC
jgi:NAD/NADP transhydrogenase beta subunit